MTVLRFWISLRYMQLQVLKLTSELSHFLEIFLQFSLFIFGLIKWRLYNTIICFFICSRWNAGKLNGKQRLLKLQEPFILILREDLFVLRLFLDHDFLSHYINSLKENFKLCSGITFCDKLTIMFFKSLSCSCFFPFPIISFFYPLRIYWLQLFYCLSFDIEAFML